MSRIANAFKFALHRCCINAIHPGVEDLNDSSIQSGGGVKKIGRLTYTYGCTSQSSLHGPYSGLQCTTMALASIILAESTSKYTPTAINKTLLEGNRLHTLLRDCIKLSNEKDGRIAIEEIPYRHFIYLGKVFGKLTGIKLHEQCQYVFTTMKEGFEAFSTIKEYLRQRQLSSSARTGFLITLGDFSYAVFLRRNGRVALFDSHGHLTINGEFIEPKAGMLQFPSLDYLELFLVGMYGFETPAVIAPVYVCLIKLTRPEKLDRKEKQPERIPYQPYFSTDEDVTHDNNEEHVEIIDDCSPYIGMMGGMF